MGIDTKGIVELKELEDIIKELTHQFKEKFDNDKHYSILVNLWDDYTHRVQLRHGEPIDTNEETRTIHIFEHYKDEYTYRTLQAKNRLGTS